MKTVKICKADGWENEPVNGAIIEIVEDIPKVTPINYEELDRFYNKQAQLICDALTQSLPAGTRQRLLGLMMKQEAENVFLRVL